MTIKPVLQVLGPAALLFPATAFADQYDDSASSAVDAPMAVEEGPENQYGETREDADQYGANDFDADYDPEADADQYGPNDFDADQDPTGSSETYDSVRASEGEAFSPHNRAEGLEVDTDEALFGDSMDGDDRPDTLTSIGMSATLGGGVTGFTAQEARDYSEVGGGWDARLTMGTRVVLAGEIAYIGSSRDVSALGLDESAFLQSHGGEIAARLNLLPGLVQPYVLAGAGFTYYQMSNEDFNTSSLADSETVAHFPVGAGATLRYEGFVADARGVFRPTPTGDLFSEDSEMHTWGANLSLGTEF